MTATAPASARPASASAAAAEPAVSTARPRRMMWPELDLLRGLAGLAMVVNHTAVGLVPPAAVALIALPDAPLSMTPTQWATFLGSFAPMMFFFITGVGYGLQARPGGVRGKPGLWPKVVVLVLADAMLWRVGGLWIGLDFFAFIALSMVLLATLNRLDRKLALGLAAVVMVVLSGLRYAAVPLAGKVLGPEALDLVAVLAGHRVVPGVSFPPLPWLGYPLAGFLAGAAMTAFAQGVDRRRFAVAAGLLGVGAVCLAATGFLATHGYPLHRWGRLAPSSYAAGFALLAALGAACLMAFGSRLAPGTRPNPEPAASAADRGPRWPLGPTVRGLSLRGVAAFAVVPLHFLAIALAEIAGVEVVSAGGLWLAWVGIATLALGLAPGVSIAAERLRTGRHAAGAWWAGLAVAMVALALLSLPSAWATLGTDGIEAPLRSAIASVAQLGLCLLLALPVPWVGAEPPRAKPLSTTGPTLPPGSANAALSLAATGEPAAIVR